jgi:hypothetical protein
MSLHSRGSRNMMAFIPPILQVRFQGRCPQLPQSLPCWALVVLCRAMGNCWHRALEHARLEHARLEHATVYTVDAPLGSKGSAPNCGWMHPAQSKQVISACMRPARLSLTPESQRRISPDHQERTSCQQSGVHAAMPHSCMHLCSTLRKRAQMLWLHPDAMFRICQYSRIATES